MTANKSFYSFEKTEERGKKSLKKILHITVKGFAKAWLQDTKVQV